MEGEDMDNAQCRSLKHGSLHSSLYLLEERPKAMVLEHDNSTSLPQVFLEGYRWRKRPSEQRLHMFVLLY